MSFEARCQELGLEFYDIPEPIAGYTHAVRDGHHVYLSGHGPFHGPDNIQEYRGKVGRDLSIEEAQNVARFVALGCLQSVRNLIGSLDLVQKIIRVTGYVNAVDDFEHVSYVTDGASKVLFDVFGSEVGAHARMSIGLTATPRQVPFAMDMLIRVRD